VAFKDLDDILDSLSDEEKAGLRTQILIEKARNFSAGGFEAFFELLLGLKLPEHHKFAISSSFDAYEAGRGIVIEMFRGAAKTTVFNTALSCYLIGHYPDRVGLLVQVGDSIANDNAGTIAYHIEHNPGFKAVFPNIVPDKDRGWGANGYCVKRDDIPYSEWVRLLGKKAVKDPTFIGVGYKSSAIIGKRPFWLILDDINDENNTGSERESLKVETILTGTIFPAANMAQFMVMIGTPWTYSDAIHYAVASEEFEHIKIPVYKENGDPQWEEVFGEAEIQKQKNLAGEIEFARMFLLDLEKTKGLVLKKEWLHTYPAEYINQDWIRYIGVDFTSTNDPMRKDTDYFSLAVGAVIPGKGLVIEDGIYERLSQADAEGQVVAWCAKYPTLMGVGVEAIITGRMFYENLLNNAQLRASGVHLIPVAFNKTKGYRFEKMLAPLFQRAQIYISDEQNTFLRAFQNEWMNWQGDALEKMYHNDALDAVYSLTVAAQMHVSPVANFARVGANNPFFGRERQPNPWSSLGSK
jgi:hypothetical protein